MMCPMLPWCQQMCFFWNLCGGRDIPPKNLALQPRRDSGERVLLARRICAAGQVTRPPGSKGLILTFAAMNFWMQMKNTMLPG